uniref:Uncharacterized protein n=1 Tax=Arundo donax TaxID=35708 RepID=A0A0A9FCN2_ARUDO
MNPHHNIIGLAPGNKSNIGNVTIYSNIMFVLWCIISIFIFFEILLFTAFWNNVSCL